MYIKKTFKVKFDQHFVRPFFIKNQLIVSAEKHDLKT